MTTIRLLLRPPPIVRYGDDSSSPGNGKGGPVVAAEHVSGNPEGADLEPPVVLMIERRARKRADDQQEIRDALARVNAAEAELRMIRRVLVARLASGLPTPPVPSPELRLLPAD